MAHDLKRFRKKRFIEFFSLQFLRNFRYNRFRICYAELTLFKISEHVH
ncbi:hypothetical protein LEP1GSC170_1870 [Leptospira interrogans serovar Bataviae str. HAI135]|nr:hypothetical protein LEP1GSC170_1870 [Leptospira interrogans serovar Bataviae str. HAI135]